MMATGTTSTMATMATMSTQLTNKKTGKMARDGSLFTQASYVLFSSLQHISKGEEAVWRKKSIMMRG